MKQTRIVEAIFWPYINKEWNPNSLVSEAYIMKSSHPQSLHSFTRSLLSFMKFWFLTVVIWVFLMYLKLNVTATEFTIFSHHVYFLFLVPCPWLLPLLPASHLVSHAILGIFEYVHFFSFIHHYPNSGHHVLISVTLTDSSGLYITSNLALSDSLIAFCNQSDISKTNLSCLNPFSDFPLLWGKFQTL